MNIKKISIIFISVVVSFIFFCYVFFLYGFPKILNSDKLITKYEKFLTEKFGYNSYIKGFNFVSNPNLSFKIKVDEISVINTDTKNLVLSIKNIDYISKKISVRPKKINANKIYVDCENLKRQSKISQTKNFDLKLLSQINVNKMFIKIDKNAKLTVDKIHSKIIKNELYYSILAKFENKKLTHDIINIGKEGYIVFDGKNVYFKDFSTELGNSKLLLSGKQDNLHIHGKNLPLDEIKSYYVYFYKLTRNNKKNFIENFHNLAGNLDINLWIKKGDIEGFCVLKNMKADLFDYRIPIIIPKSVFKFNQNQIHTKTNGYIDGNIAPLSFSATGLFSDKFTVKGDVSTVISESFTKKYYPDIIIDGSANVSVRYKTHKGKVDVDYKLNLKKDSDITYKKYKLGSGKRERFIEAFTTKLGDKIVLKNYIYSFINKKGEKIPVFSGNGEFKKINNHFVVDFITIRTLKNIPISAVQFIAKDYVEGGTFTSDLKFEFLTKTISGQFDLHDVHHKDFLFLKNVHLEILNNLIQVTTAGTFFDSPITMNIVAENNFNENILVHDIDIHLNKFIVKREKYSNIPSSYKNMTQNKKSKKRNYNIEIESGRIVVDEILHSKFYLHDIEILGNLKDDIVNFLTKPTQYSKGTLISVGQYNIANHSSDIEFCASDIDSNEVVSKIFNLPNQVNGLASATLHLITKNKLNDIKADASFMIENGRLPKLGSTEFIFKKTDRMKRFKFLNFEKIKFSLSKITNIDFSSKKVSSAAQINGTFSLDNEQVKNSDIYFTSDFVSMFIEGDYNINSQYANLYVWGRHNKTAEKKIRILKLPFTFLYRIIFRPEHTRDLHVEKIQKIPPIKMKIGDEESVFRVIIDGNLNSENFKVNMKDLK